MGRKKLNKTPEQYAESFWRRVDKTDSCWLWLGAINNNGYGVFRVVVPEHNRGKIKFAHRFSYELVKGPIPEGLHLDHLCRVRNCCNPDHLEAVTPKVNSQRGALTYRTHCPKGHEMTSENIYIRPDGEGRACLRCKNHYWSTWYAKNKEKISARDKAKRLASIQRVREAQVRRP